jgi:hypothetical protein
VKTPGQRALSARHFVEHLPGPARPPRPDLSFSPVGFHAIRCIALTINFTRYFIRLPFAGSFDPGRRSSSSQKKKKQAEDWRSRNLSDKGKQRHLSPFVCLRRLVASRAPTPPQARGNPSSIRGLLHFVRHPYWLVATVCQYVHKILKTSSQLLFCMFRSEVSCLRCKNSFNHTTKVQDTASIPLSTSIYIAEREYKAIMMSNE